MRMVEENISIHDKYQFELKYAYPLDLARPQAEYAVESFLFIPNNLGVSPQSYSRADFNNDMQKYIRLGTPKMYLHAIFDGVGCPLKKIKESMELLCGDPGNEHAVSEYFYHVKMFCSIVKSAMRDEESYIESLPPGEDRRQVIERYLEHVEKLLESFRKLKMLAHATHVNKKIASFYCLADEYLSLISEKHLCCLICFLRDSKSKYSQAFSERAVKKLRFELDYRRKNHYPSIPVKNGSNEETLYRQRILKKIMGSILFLKTSVRTEGRLLEQIVSGVAAGLAMLFATISLFLSRRFFADLTLSLLFVLVISYVFKDRIKELTRLYMVSWIRKRLYDYKTELRTNMDVKIGICRELFAFVDEQNLPPEIIKIRNKDYLGELDNGYAPENILYSKKQIRIFSKPCRKLFADLQADGVIDIIRIDVRNFMKKMDNPRKILFVPDGDDNIEPVKGDSVYHLNLILKYQMEKNSEYRKFRIVLNRSGIKRIVADN